MKLALVLVLLLSGPSVAGADDRIPVDPYAEPGAWGVPVDPFGAPRVDGRVPVNPFADPAPRPRVGKQRKHLRRMLLQHFDRNGDGQLQPRERKQAARALRRLAMRMHRGTAPDARRKKFIRRFDRDRDGNIGPGELPPALADELRPLDRDGDGWLHGNELP